MGRGFVTVATAFRGHRSALALTRFFLGLRHIWIKSQIFWINNLGTQLFGITKIWSQPFFFFFRCHTFQLVQPACKVTYNAAIAAAGRAESWEVGIVASEWHFRNDLRRSTTVDSADFFRKNAILSKISKNR